MAAVEVARERGARPLYIQMAEDISSRIRRGDLRPGDRVASEPELMRQHAVSRATAVKALEHLERAGLVRREQGRGTFVREPHLVQRQPVLGSFSEQVRRHGHVPTQRLVQLAAVQSIEERPEAAHWFGDEAKLVEIVRLRIVDGKPVGVHATVLQRETVDEAGIGESSFAPPDASLYALLDAAGIHVVEADEHLQAIAASKQEAKTLGVKPGTPLMRVVRVSFGANGSPIEVTDARYVGDRFDYSVSLVRPRPGSSVADELHDTRGESDAGSKARGARDGAERRPGGGRVRQVR
jgi:GntR family transcriptional regulator, N-acetylglucosamine utilization regulator